MRPGTLLLLVAILVAALALNYRYRHAHPGEVVVLQIDHASQADPALLLERQPVVLPKDDLGGLTRFMYLYARRQALQAQAADFCSTAAYAAVVPQAAGAGAGAAVVITSPDRAAPFAVDVRLTPDRALVLPFGWSYRCDAPHERVTYHDLAHLLAGGAPW
jgi:hypothetical protein